MPQALAGLWPPVSTPFGTDGEVDYGRLTIHSRRLLADGATGLAILGTTSEANSLTLDERRRAIAALVDAGIPGDKLMPGTGACAIGDAAELSAFAGEAGARAVLLLPPFYYKKVSDEALFTFVARVIEKAGARMPQIMLYHIPPMATIGWSIPLVQRLKDAFPELIVGMKDSSGDYETTKSFITAFPDLAIFPGSEIYLLKALGDGAKGCISATANVNAYGISQLLARWKTADAPELQEGLKRVRTAVESRVTIPALKAVLAERYRDPTWLAVRPPLSTITEETRKALLADPVIIELLEAVPA